MFKKLLEMFECDDACDKRISFGRVWTAVCILLTFGLAVYSVYCFTPDEKYYRFIPVGIFAFISILPYLITKWTTVKEIIAAAKGQKQ